MRRGSAREELPDCGWADGFPVFLWPSPESLADSLETSTRGEGHREEAKQGPGTAGPSRRPEERGDRPQPRAQVSLAAPGSVSGMPVQLQQVAH